MSAWIKCSERMPEDRQRALICVPSPSGTRVISAIFLRITTGSFWATDTSSDISAKYIAFWMPLPEPPSEQAAEEKANR